MFVLSRRFVFVATHLYIMIVVGKRYDEHCDVGRAIHNSNERHDHDSHTVQPELKAKWQVPVNLVYIM